MSTYSLQTTDDPHGMVSLVQLKASHLAETIRLVADTRDWTIAGLTYTALPMSIRLPTQDGGETPAAQLVLDNVGRTFSELLEGMGTTDTITVTLSVADRNNTATKTDLFVGRMSSVQINARTMQATISDDATMRQAAVRRRFDITTAPGLWPR
jgi:hypothetical protein